MRIFNKKTYDLLPHDSFTNVHINKDGELSHIYTKAKLANGDKVIIKYSLKDGIIRKTSMKFVPNKEY